MSVSAMRHFFFITFVILITNDKDKYIYLRGPCLRGMGRRSQSEHSEEHYGPLGEASRAVTTRGTMFWHLLAHTRCLPPATA